MKKEGREREGRTDSHVGDTGCIPLGEITVERRGLVKRYIQKKQKDKKVIQKKKESRRTILLIKDSLSNKIIDDRGTYCLTGQ